MARFARPETLARIDTSRHQVIEASAGTGKTYTLEHLIIELLLVRQIPIEQILVVTFTEKATGELVARVRARLERLLAGDFAAAPPDVPAWEIDAAARQLLERALFAFDTASISTIHAFCQRVLTEHAFAHHRLFDQSAVDEEGAWAAAFREELRRDLARDPSRSPYLAAWLAHRSIEELEKLLRDCARARGTLRPRFDEGALRVALAALPPLDGAVKAALGGIRGPARGALLRRFEQLAAAAEVFRSDGAAAFLVAAEEVDFAYLAERAHLLEGRGAASSFLEAALAVSRQAVGLEAAVAQLFQERVLARSRAQKSAAGQFDFQDMLRLVAESLEGAGGDRLRATLRRRYRAALIDEFQDTDDVQWSIFRRLFVDRAAEAAEVAEAAEAEGEVADSTLFVIGDPKQAIYGFRGADVHTYFRARRALGEPLPLTRNFRSTPRLIAACNEILSQSADKPLFDGPIEYRHPVAAGRPALVAVDAAGRPATPVRLLCPVSPAGKLDAPTVQRVLARRIAVEIRLLLDPAQPPLRIGEGEALEPIAAHEIFVLTRSTEEGYRVGEALAAAGVPHAFYKQDGLFQRAEAGHVLDLLRAIADPHHPSRRYRAFLTPFFALSLADLDGLRELPPSDPLLQRLLDWKALADERDFARLFSRILDDSGIVRRELFLRRGERELTNYLHLFEILLQEAGRSHATLADLCLELAAFIDGARLPEGEDGGVQRLESDRCAVQIMSIHKAKGLEAAVVFLFGGFGRPPGSRVNLLHDDDGERIAWVGTATGEIKERIEREIREEDQRLLYVALTRARARLYLPLFREVEEPDGGRRVEEFRSLGGCYRQLNDRLRRVVADCAGDAALAELFSVEELPADGAPEERATATAAVAGFRVPDAGAVDPEEAGRYASWRREHAGFVVTSYSGIKRTRGGYHAPPERDDEDGAAAAVDAAGEGALPGGRVSGNFLHSLLEELPLETLTPPAPPVEAWSRRAEVRRILEDNAALYGIERRHLSHAARLVHAALCSPVRLGDGALLSGIAAAQPRLLRETEFLFPIPERHHPRLDAAAGAARNRFVVERGFVRGFVDVVFEHRGLAHIADWKSDSLSRWDGAALAEHVAKNYRLQAQLYSLALVKMLDVHDEASYLRRFGGYLYCFLRGMRGEAAGESGCVAGRPAWTEILAWEEELLGPDLLDGAVRP